LGAYIFNAYNDYVINYNGKYIWHLADITYESGVRVVDFATPEILVVKVTMFTHRKIHKYRQTSSGGKTQIDNVLTDKRKHSNILDVRSFRRADCDTDHYLVVADMRVIEAVSKRAAQKMDMKKFDLKNLNEGKLKESIRVKSETNMQLWEN
jgi:hypothetical protein